MNVLVVADVETKQMNTLAMLVKEESVKDD